MVLKSAAFTYIILWKTLRQASRSYNYWAMILRFPLIRSWGFELQFRKNHGSFWMLSSRKPQTTLTKPVLKWSSSPHRLPVIATSSNSQWWLSKKLFQELQRGHFKNQFYSFFVSDNRIWSAGDILPPSPEAPTVCTIVISESLSPS